VTDPAARLACRVRRRCRAAPAAAIVLLLGALPAAAHKLNVFAAADGARIEGSAYFAGGGKATGARILITDAAGGVLAELSPAADGSFSWQARAPVEHHVVAETEDGHRAEWVIGASELAGAFPGVAGEPGAAAEAVGDAAAAGAASEVTDTSPPGATDGLDPALGEAIERAVARQVRPLREAMLEAREAAQLRDVLGGIGYIVGLAGLALWWRSRRAPEPPVKER